MKRAMLACCFLSLLAVFCQASPLQRTPDGTAASRLTEAESARLAREEIKEVVGDQLVQVNWVTLKRGNLVFLVNYATDLKPDSQPDAFSDQFNRVALIASTYFHRTDTESVNVMVMAEDVDFPTADRNPPLRQIVIEKAAISDWANGELTDAEFIESWFVVPLSVFPTPG